MPTAMRASRRVKARANRRGERDAEPVWDWADANPAGDWPRRLAGRAAGRRHCPSGEGARYAVCGWRRFGNGLTAAGVGRGVEFAARGAVIAAPLCEG